MVKFVRKLCSKFMVPAALQCHKEPCEIALKKRQTIYQEEKAATGRATDKHAQFVDVRQRAENDIEDVLYFVERFPHLLPYHGPEEHDLLGEEFLNDQTMPMISLQDETEMESFWAEMATRKHK
ncbi:hypothetical protein J4Q44_G00174300 [Coregonus suidteri]|uniref:Uncharacterized protein n=1 Tax=Coregonus suidteri TaxID=861788 RepID=A0AAN8QUJ7_9TELE